MFKQINEITKSIHLPRVDELVKQAVQNFENESYEIVFDCSKSLVECCCKTILNDLNVKYDSDEDFQKVLKKTLQNLALLPETHQSEAQLRESISKTINGFNTIAQGIGELRNSQGIMAHGGDGSYIGLGRSYALLMINLSDAISTFLLGRHKDFSERAIPSLSFEANPIFNERLNEEFGSLTIFETAYEASEILFELDPQGYEAYLTEFKSEGSDEN